MHFPIWCPLFSQFKILEVAKNMITCDISCLVYSIYLKLQRSWSYFQRGNEVANKLTFFGEAGLKTFWSNIPRISFDFLPEPQLWKCSVSPTQEYWNLRENFSYFIFLRKDSKKKKKKKGKKGKKKIQQGSRILKKGAIIVSWDHSLVCNLHTQNDGRK